MMRHSVAYLLVTAATVVGLATAQSSQVRSSSSKSVADPIQSATKPLTPKSAMPAHRKASVVAPTPPPSSEKTTAELNHLEHQNIKTGSAASGSSKAPKSVVVKPAARSSANGSGINATYQKPAANKN